MSVVCLAVLHAGPSQANAEIPPLPHKPLLRRSLRGAPIHENSGGCRDKCTGYASVAQSVEQGTENPRVIGSIPIGGTTSKILSFIGKSCKQDFCDEYQIFSFSPQTFASQIFAGAPITQKTLSVCGRSSSGRAPPCQGGGSEFEPRRPLQHEAIVDAEMQRRWLFCVSFLHRTAKNTLLQADGTVRLQKLCISSCQTARNEVFYSHSLTL